MEKLTKKTSPLFVAVVLILSSRTHPTLRTPASSGADVPLIRDYPIDADTWSPERAVIPVNTEVEKAWAQMVRDSDPANLQKGCAPTRYSPPEGVKREGAIVLTHGFTACPQQFFELARMLSDRGFEVMLPLLPGHGRKPLKNSADDISRLPDTCNWRDYFKFGEQINALVKSFPGIHVLGGLSAGAVVAAYSYESAPHLYDRLFLVSPFLSLADTRGTKVLHLLRFAPLAREIDLNFGAPCAREGKLGRGGICSYKVREAAAIDFFGEDIMAKFNVSSKTKIQIMATEKDPLANDKDSELIAKRLTTGDEDVHFCMGPQAIGHEPYSRFDHPWENKFWLPDLFKKTVAFLADGEVFKTDGMSKLNPAYSLCAIK